MRILSIVIFLSILAVLPAYADNAVTIVGGTPRLRQEIAFTETHALAGLVLSDPPVTVDIVTAEEMKRLVDTGSPNGLPSDSDGDGIIDGIYDSNPATIHILASDGKQYFEQTFVHEYGHHVWTYFLSTTDRKEYQRVYKKERDGGDLITTYAANSKEEGFAEDFAYFILHPYKLERVAPQSYRYMQDIVVRLHDAYAAQSQYAVNQSTGN